MALLKQGHQMGLNKEMTIFNAFITNVVAKGLPPEALEGVYAMHYFYYDLAGFADKEVAKSRQGVHRPVSRQVQRPPDAYATIAYIAYMEMFRGFEAVQEPTTRPRSRPLMAPTRASSTRSRARPAGARITSAEYKYAAFLVKGKGAKEQKNEWDLFTVVEGCRAASRSCRR